MLKAAGARDCQRMRISLEKEPDTFSRNGTVYWICEKIFFGVTIVGSVKDCKEKLQFFFYAMVLSFKTSISENSV